MKTFFQDPSLEPIEHSFLSDWWKYGQCSLPATTADWFSAETTIGLWFLNRQKFTHSDYVYACSSTAVILLSTICLTKLVKIDIFNKFLSW